MVDELIEIAAVFALGDVGREFQLVRTANGMHSAGDAGERGLRRGQDCARRRADHRLEFAERIRAALVVREVRDFLPEDPLERRLDSARRHGSAVVLLERVEHAGETIPGFSGTMARPKWAVQRCAPTHHRCVGV